MDERTFWAEIPASVPGARGMSRGDEDEAGGTPEALAFARDDGRPYSGTALRDRAPRAWKAAGLNPITPHECRHTCASVWIAAGVNIKALSTYMGHANIAITLDRYGHLMPGSEDEALGSLMPTSRVRA